jgi:hypothetical protein
VITLLTPARRMTRTSDISRQRFRFDQTGGLQKSGRKSRSEGVPSARALTGGDLSAMCKTRHARRDPALQVR